MPPRSATAGTRKKKAKVEVEKQEEPSVTEPIPQDHVIVQLNISSQTIEDIIQCDNFQQILEYRPDIRDPIPYNPCNFFDSQNDQLETLPLVVESKKDKKTVKASNEIEPAMETNAQIYEENKLMCFWCCHDIGASRYGMPCAYDGNHNSFSVYGHFCSLECCAAHNFSVHMGCDRMWEIHSWIQLYARQIGYGTPVRPAPSRYLLKMFGGPMAIDEFRTAHKGSARTYVLNIPPLVNIQPQVESINTSFLFKNKTELGDQSKTIRKKSIVDSSKTLDHKMNLSYE